MFCRIHETFYVVYTYYFTKNAFRYFIKFYFYKCTKGTTYALEIIIMFENKLLASFL